MLILGVFLLLFKVFLLYFCAFLLLLWISAGQQSTLQKEGSYKEIGKGGTTVSAPPFCLFYSWPALDRADEGSIMICFGAGTAFPRQAFASH